MALSIFVPLGYIVFLTLSMSIFSRIYRNRKASAAMRSSHQSWFPEGHPERDIYQSLVLASSGPGSGEEGKEQVPEVVLKAALLNRAMADVKRIIRLRDDKAALGVLLQKGSMGDETLHRLSLAEKELEAEILDVVSEANTFREGWGQLIFTTAGEMVAHMKHKEHYYRIQEQRAIETKKLVDAGKPVPQPTIALPPLVTPAGTTIQLGPTAPGGTTPNPGSSPARPVLGPAPPAATPGNKSAPGSGASTPSKKAAKKAAKRAAAAGAKSATVADEDDDDEQDSAPANAGEQELEIWPTSPLDSPDRVRTAQLVPLPPFPGTPLSGNSWFDEDDDEGDSDLNMEDDGDDEEGSEYDYYRYGYSYYNADYYPGHHYGSREELSALSFVAGVFRRQQARMMGSFGYGNASPGYSDDGYYSPRRDAPALYFVESACVSPPAVSPGLLSARSASSSGWRSVPDSAGSGGSRKGKKGSKTGSASSLNRHGKRGGVPSPLGPWGGSGSSPRRNQVPATAGISRTPTSPSHGLLPRSAEVPTLGVASELRAPSSAGSTTGLGFLNPWKNVMSSRQGIEAQVAKAKKGKKKRRSPPAQTQQEQAEESEEDVASPEETNEDAAGPSVFRTPAGTAKAAAARAAAGQMSPRGRRRP